MEGLSRTNPLKALRSLARAGAAVLRARALLGELRADAVLGGGGYVAGPVGVAALTRRIPLVLSEADSHLGLTNRALAPLAQASVPGLPDRGPQRAPLPCDRPPDPRLDARLARARASAWGWRRRRPACWSSAARWGRARSISPRWRRSPERPFTYCTSAAAATTQSWPAGSCPRGYDLREYLDLEEFADALSAADLVVARAGGSVFEIAAHGLPAILVPYPHAAADHQSANARWMAQAGAAVVIADGELTSARLAREVAALLADPRPPGEHGRGRAQAGAPRRRRGGGP